MRNIIFHIPSPLNPDDNSGSKLRPSMMIKAFNNIGYNVDIVSGYGKKRKAIIARIKKGILQGKKYDFIYAESLTTPMLLSEKHHLPTYPFLDFNFFRFCKRHGIKTGLFYRDMHWQFGIFKESLGFLKRTYTVFFYKYDLKQYSKSVYNLFLPSVLMEPYISNLYKGKFSSLPPGITNLEPESEKYEYSPTLPINIFYVGGISNTLYKFDILPKVIARNNSFTLCICCRYEEWEKNKESYLIEGSEQLSVIHKSGVELTPFFKEAGIFSMFYALHEYRDFAMPYKLFEYLSYRRPIIATKGTAAGDFVEKHDIGWAIHYEEDELLKLLQAIAGNPEMIKEKINNIDQIYEAHTWESRAKEVANILS